MAETSGKPGGEFARLRGLDEVLSRVPSWVNIEPFLDILRRDFVVEAITKDIGDLLCTVSPPSRDKVLDKLTAVDAPQRMGEFVEFLCGGTIRKRPFPASPVSATSLLTPLGSPPAIRDDSLATGIPFDSFWIESILEGVAYFYAWHGHPLATVLVVFADESINWIEVRGEGDTELSQEQSKPIISYVLARFRQAGFRLGRWEGRRK